MCAWYLMVTVTTVLFVMVWNILADDATKIAEFMNHRGYPWPVVSAISAEDAGLRDHSAYYDGHAARCGSGRHRALHAMRF